MPNHVLQIDCSGGAGPLIEVDWGSNEPEVWVYADVALDAAGLANLLTNPSSFTTFDLVELSSHTFQDAGAEWYVDTGPTIKWAGFNSPGSDPAGTPFNPTPALASMQFYRIKIHIVAGSPITQEIWIDSDSIGTVDVTSSNMVDIRLLDLFQPGLTAGFIYFDNIKVGSTDGATDIFSDDFEGGDLSAWTTVDPPDAFSIITDPGITAAGESPAAGSGRVLIAFDDDPLEPNPTWTIIDQGGDFPEQFVSGYDTTSGRQTLLQQTDTGTATVYINDHELGLFDPRNTLSPYFGLLDGKQILLQLYNPVTTTWEPQFQGWIDEASYDIDGSAVNADGDPINASIQLRCVDMFDILGGYGLTPGLDGVTPRTVPSGSAGGPVPAGFEDGVYYAETAGSVDDRIIEILADVGIDSTRYIVASGNVKVIAVKYDPDEAAIVALRDACDAEIPFIANMYVNRHGQFVFRGRYSRFYPDLVAAEPGSEWDFTRWAVGDGKAIEGDPTRAQMRVLSYTRGRFDIINVAVCYPQGLKASDMPGQVFADTSSITSYGKHSAPPMSDLLTKEGTVSGFNAKQETAAFAELLVKNKKGPHVAVSALQVKTVHPDDDRAEATWAFLTESDISHIVNVKVGYPGGTGLTGGSPADDHFIEGRALVVRPLAGDQFDYVELNVETTPIEWSSDFHGVFPNPFS